MRSFFDFFGGKTLRLNNDMGALGIFFFRSFIMIFRLKAIPDIIAQVYFIGAKSTQIVLLVGFFTGMVLGLQLYFVLVKFGSVGVLGTAIALTLIREMGPVLAAIMITARAGSAMTAEIGFRCALSIACCRAKCASRGPNSASFLSTPQWVLLALPTWRPIIRSFSPARRTWDRHLQFGDLITAPI
jgi:phospholipid/cholesterol/gamma-HCH transport system permease protein